ncbi:hypothetical protein MRB53_040710 [Persea americana]|nr:hypothetical protein MRB53_040710 [Persea americana]
MSNHTVVGPTGPELIQAGDFYQSASILHPLVIGTIILALLFAYLRLSSNRSIAPMTVFDSVVSVAMGSTLAGVVVSDPDISFIARFSISAIRAGAIPHCMLLRSTEWHSPRTRHHRARRASLLAIFHILCLYALASTPREGPVVSIAGSGIPRAHVGEGHAQASYKQKGPLRRAARSRSVVAIEPTGQFCVYKRADFPEKYVSSRFRCLPRDSCSHTDTSFGRSRRFSWSSRDTRRSWNMSKRLAETVMLRTVAEGFVRLHILIASLIALGCRRSCQQCRLSVEPSSVTADQIELLSKCAPDPAHQLYRVWRMDNRLSSSKFRARRQASTLPTQSQTHIKMDAAQTAINSLFSKKADAKDDTATSDSTTAAPVTKEHVTKTQEEDVQKVIEKEKHQDHYHTTIQPLSDKETLPEEHKYKEAETQHKSVNKDDDAKLSQKLSEQKPKFEDSKTVGDTIKTKTMNEDQVAGEHVHHHHHETIQPVIEKETIAPTKVHTVVPVKETIQEESKVHETTTAPVMSKAEYEKRQT